jgi:hypothetical protein
MHIYRYQSGIDERISDFAPVEFATAEKSVYRYLGRTLFMAKQN